MAKLCVGEQGQLIRVEILWVRWHHLIQLKALLEHLFTREQVPHVDIGDTALEVEDGVGVLVLPQRLLQHLLRHIKL